MGYFFSFHSHLSHHVPIYWCTSQFPHFDDFASQKLSYRHSRPSSSQIGFILSKLPPARAGHTLETGCQPARTHRIWSCWTECAQSPGIGDPRRNLPWRMMLTTHKNGDSGGIRDGVWHSFYHIIAKSGFLYIYIYISFLNSPSCLMWFSTQAEVQLIFKTRAGLTVQVSNHETSFKWPIWGKPFSWRGEIKPFQHASRSLMESKSTILININSGFHNYAVSKWGCSNSNIIKFL